MKRITIGHIPGDTQRPLTLSVDSLVESKLLVQANSGGGKSNTIRLLAEKLSPILPCVIIDPEGEFATLREKVDLVLVGEGGELAATPNNAGEVALKLLGLGVSAVIDLYGLVPQERREWVRRYCENLIAAPRKLWRPFVLLIDEAQEFAPEKAEASSHGPLIEVMTKARKRDCCPILVTPRLAMLDADARGPINNFLIGRATLDIDYKRGGEILGIPHGERRKLASLKKGQFHAFGPAFGHDAVEFVQLDQAVTRPAETGKSAKAVPAPSAAIRAVVPELEALAQPKNPDDVATIEAAKKRIGELNKLVKAAEREAQRAAKAVPAPVVVSESPKAGELKAARAAVARLTRLQEDLVKFIVNIEARDFSEDAGVDPAKLEAAVRLATEQATKIIEATLRARAQQVKQLKADAARLVERANAISGGLPKEVTVEVAVTKNKPFTVSPRPALPARPPPSQNGHAGDTGLSKPFRRILESAAYWRAIGVEHPTIQQLAAGASYAPSGSFDTYLSRMGTDGLLIRDRGVVDLTDEGWKVAPMVDAPASLDEHLDRVRSILDGPQVRIVNALIRVGGSPSVPDLAAACDPPYAPSGSFDTYLSRLGTKGLIVRNRGVVTPTTALIPEGLV